MTIDELVEHLKTGREIEFSFQKHPYFLTLHVLENGDSKGYELFDVLLGENIFVGSIEALLSFKFSSEISFQNNIDDFEFEYIL